MGGSRHLNPRSGLDCPTLQPIAVAVEKEKKRLAARSHSSDSCDVVSSAVTARTHTQNLQAAVARHPPLQQHHVFTGRPRPYAGPALKGYFHVVDSAQLRHRCLFEQHVAETPLQRGQPQQGYTIRMEHIACHQGVRDELCETSHPPRRDDVGSEMRRVLFRQSTVGLLT